MTKSSSDPPDIASQSSPATSRHDAVAGRSKTPPPHPSPAVKETAASASSARHVGAGNVDGPPGTAQSPDAWAADDRVPKQATSSVSALAQAKHPAVSSSSQHGQGPGSVVEAADAGRDGSSTMQPGGNEEAKKRKRGFYAELRRTFWLALTYSWLNVLLVFVPVGIVVANISAVPAGVVFAMNCIAVIPLAGVLAFATESVAANMGDSLGALLNVTFGNAVELIIFIALVKDQIRIVQASLLGSILANLLLILGMGFFLGGLRYREQVYNSTVTQMSACLLSLSVISLVLPTAFHASFNDPTLADNESLKISRGTSVILLLVYGIYLLFQLKSHAYMYESTPQHIVDAESVPGPAAAWLDSSSSDSSSDSSSESDSSSRSREKMRRRMKKVLRAGRRRKSSTSTSFDTVDTKPRNGSVATTNTNGNDEVISETASALPRVLPPISSTDANEEAAVDEKDHGHRRHRRRRRHHHHKRKHRRPVGEGDVVADGGPTTGESCRGAIRDRDDGEPRRVDFAVPETDGTADAPPKRPFSNLRSISVRNLAPTVFVQKPEAPAPAGPVPRVRYGIRRTNSLPDRLDHQQQMQMRPPGAMLPAHVPLMALNGGAVVHGNADGDEADEEHLSRVGSVILLLVTTGLVAVCAEFLVGSIEAVVKSSSIGEIFIGLIILPIVGNAAEHVTAITVAMKNKMDLAIGVAVGSSIQIALFVTPLIVILGWITHHDMTLYFTLFETVSLFVSAFMVNFLVLDGRSNYLEGALLCAVYIIISIVAFFYPDEKHSSQWGG
ncbi:hypothetical protein RJ55_04934 [Drechmeria coniospora]|nr:hypothetical protein RJ55_04934 [Drechmeria coniospora]